MSKLSELIQQYCPDGCEYKSFKVADVQYIRGITYKKIDERQKHNENNIRVFRANNITLNTNSLNYNDLKKVSSDIKIHDKQWLKKGDILICAASGSKEHIGKVAYIEENIHITFGGFMGVVRCGNTELNPRYMFHTLTNRSFREHLGFKADSPTINNINNEVMDTFEFPVPPMPVQEEIVRILDKFTELETELETELSMRKKQYDAIMNKLIEQIEKYCPDGVEYIPLWQLTSWDKRFKEVENSKQIRIDEYHYYLAAELNSIISENGDIKILTTSKTDLYTTEELAGDNVVDAEIICIPWGGNPIVQYYNGKFVTSDNRIARVLDANKLNTRYLYYAMINKIKTIASFYRGSGIKHPAMANVLNIEIPVPPMPVQEEIVRILDKFSKLTTDISEGLPAEIKMRHQQYEYYRDKLLSFKRLEKN